jgi:hypothetical protein
MREKLIIPETQQLRVHAFGLYCLRILYGFFAKLGNDWFCPANRRCAGKGWIFFRDDGTNLLFFTEEERDFSVVDAKSVDYAIAVVDGVGKGIVELLVQLVIGVDPAHGQKKTAETTLE